MSSILPHVIQWSVSEQGAKDAAKRAEALGALRKSITKGSGNLAGYMGEAAVAEYFRSNGITVTRDDTHDYDLCVGGVKVEVKTKRTTVDPEPFHTCSVCTRTRTQSCEVYVFTRWNTTTNTVHLLGYWPSSELGNPPVRFHKEGDEDGSTRFTFKADCYNVDVAFLRDISKLCA